MSGKSQGNAFFKIREMSGNLEICQGKIEFWKIPTNLCQGNISFPGVHAKNVAILGHQVPIFFFSINFIRLSLTKT